MRLHALLAQVTTRRAIGLDVAGRRDVVGRHRVAQQGQYAGVVDIGDPWRRPFDAFEERWVLNVGRVLLPHVRGSLWHFDSLPLLVAREHFGIFLVEHGCAHLGHRFGDFLLARPDILQIDRLPLLVGAQ